MKDLPELAKSQIEVAATHTPSLTSLQTAVRRRRHRHRLIAGSLALVATASGVGAVLSSLDSDKASEVRTRGVEVGSLPDASVPGKRLPVVGPEASAGEGRIDGKPWTLIAYRTTPSADGLERICSEFRTDGDGRQSCFPIDPARGPGERWAFIEHVAGAAIYVIAADPGTDITIDNTPIEGLDHDLGLPVRFGTRVLDGDGPFMVSTGANVSVNPGTGHPGDGSRQPISIPGRAGVFFERLTSSNPAADGWIRFAVRPPDEIGYLNPDDYYNLDARSWLPPDQRIPSGPPPVYDADGHQIGWVTCGGFSEQRERACSDIDHPTTTVVG